MLGPDDYRQFVLPHLQAVINGILPGVPIINFGTGNPALLPLYREAGGDVIGIDWRVDLATGWQMVGHDRAVQGNLEPMKLLGERAGVVAATESVLKQAAGRPGHIFNLGHGVLPGTPVDNVLALIETVKSWKLQSSGDQAK